jgi:hypothetical protein
MTLIAVRWKRSRLETASVMTMHATGAAPSIRVQTDFIFFGPPRGGKTDHNETVERSTFTRKMYELSEARLCLLVLVMEEIGGKTYSSRVFLLSCDLLPICGSSNVETLFPRAFRDFLEDFPAAKCHSH